MADLITLKNKSILYKVLPTPAIREVVVKVKSRNKINLRLLTNTPLNPQGHVQTSKKFYNNLVQYAHCIYLFKIYLNTLKEKSEEWADKPLKVIIAVAKSPLGTKEKPQHDNKKYINSRHNSISKDKELDIKTENNIDRDIPEFLKQSNRGEAAEENKAKDKGEAKAEDKGEAKAETKNKRKEAAKKEIKGLDRAKNTIRVFKVRKKKLLPIKFNLNKVFNIAYITGV